MNTTIQNLPSELLDDIFIKVGGGTQLELVCKKWNYKCKSKYLNRKRTKCICFKGLDFSKKCDSISHFCMCNK